MLKMLSLIGMIFVGSLFAAETAALPTVDDLDTQLRQTHQRATNAATFEVMAVQSACAADDEARAILNISLINSFKQMEKEIGVSSLLTLQTIETKEGATAACTYYMGAKATLSALVQRLTIQLDERYEEAEAE